MSEVTVQKKAAVEEPVKQKRVKIILDNGDHIPRNGLMLGHNGTMYLLKPGVVAEVPEALLNVLNDAIIGHPITDPESQQIVDYQPRMKYPYRLVNT